jgi:trehalose utilization protein
VQRIMDGRMSLIALHSAHWSLPFVEAMNERTKQDVRKNFSGQNVSFQYITPEHKAPKIGDPLTPRLISETNSAGEKVVKVFLPNCVFPSWRADAAPSHVATLLPAHPIAKGVPLRFDISQTEMYNEPFHVPTPDAVIFEERWDKGEHFRSGCVWELGKGKVFYFRPGHEIYKVYFEPVPLQILANAALWLGGQ